VKIGHRERIGSREDPEFDLCLGEEKGSKGIIADEKGTGKALCSVRGKNMKEPGNESAVMRRPAKLNKIKLSTCNHTRESAT